jgi:hypothetical protein
MQRSRNEHRHTSSRLAIGFCGHRRGRISCVSHLFEQRIPSVGPSTPHAARLNYLCRAASVSLKPSHKRLSTFSRGKCRDLCGELRTSSCASAFVSCDVSVVPVPKRSTAFSGAVRPKWEYLSVVSIRLCPRSVCTARSWTPDTTSRPAKVWVSDANENWRSRSVIRPG